jgi:hypothetical protein
MPNRRKINSKVKQPKTLFLANGRISTFNLKKNSNYAAKFKKKENSFLRKDRMRGFKKKKITAESSRPLLPSAVRVLSCSSNVMQSSNVTREPGHLSGHTQKKEDNIKSKAECFVNYSQ